VFNNRPAAAGRAEIRNLIENVLKFTHFTPASPKIRYAEVKLYKSYRNSLIRYGLETTARVEA
jgi:hypothetical protein